MLKVLISYVSADREIAHEIADRLSHNLVEPRMDNIQTASKGSHKRESQAITEQLQKYDFVIALISGSYLSSSWMDKELTTAINIHQSQSTPFLIPVVLENACELPPFCPDPINVQSGDIDAAYAEISKLLTGFRQMFVIMKFNDELLDSAFATAIQPAATDFDLEAFTIAEVENSDPLPPQILRAIERSRVVLADLTGDRPNCYFEAGYALGQRKEIILTCREGDKPHFDVADRKIIFWKTDNDLKLQLISRLTKLKEEGLL
jgi:hypothetical protein